MNLRSALGNHLLDALPDQEFHRIEPALKMVHLNQGQVIYESGVYLDSVYFPVTSIVSLVYLLEDGASSGFAAAGNEGALGISIFMGGKTTPSRAVVQHSGLAYRLESKHLLQEFRRGGPVMNLLLRYVQALITQVSQTAVCNRHHSIDQQMSRWLLRTMDRVGSKSIKITHEMIANELGVRRESISLSAERYQRLGYINNTRGAISVLDRAGLERKSCECYFAIKNEFTRLVLNISPGDPLQILGDTMPNSDCLANCAWVSGYSHHENFDHPATATPLTLCISSCRA